MDYLSCTGLKATKHNAGNHSPFSGKIVRSRLCGIHMRIGSFQNCGRKLYKTAARKGRG